MGITSGELGFRNVSGSLFPMRFSRTEDLLLAYQGKGTRRFNKVGHVVPQLFCQPGDAMVLFHPELLPRDIEEIFENVQVLQISDFPGVGNMAFDDLRMYCKAVGLASSLGVDYAGRPLQALNLLVGDPTRLQPKPILLDCNFRFEVPEETQRAYFGADYDNLTGRSVLVNPVGFGASEPMGTFTLSLMIAYEVGCIKLVEQAAQAGMKQEEILKEAEVFFAKAYAYNFCYYLLKVFQSASSEVSSQLRPDVPNILFNLQASYQTAMDNFERLCPSEKRRFLIACDRRAGLDLGAPFSVQLTNFGISLETGRLADA